MSDLKQKTNVSDLIAEALACFGFPLVLKERSGIKRVDLLNFRDQYKMAHG